MPHEFSAALFISPSRLEMLKNMMSSTEPMKGPHTQVYETFEHEFETGVRFVARVHNGPKKPSMTVQWFHGTDYEILESTYSNFGLFILHYGNALYQMFIGEENSQ